MKDITIEKIVYAAGALCFLCLPYWTIKRIILLQSLGRPAIRTTYNVLAGIVFLLLATFLIYLFIIAKDIQPEEKDGEEIET